MDECRSKKINKEVLEMDGQTERLFGTLEGSCKDLKLNYLKFSLWL